MNTVEITSVSPHSSNALLPAVPVRIQRSRQHKQVSPNGLPIVYVGRPTKWGNPHKVGVSLAKEPRESQYDYRRMTAEDAVKAFRETILYWIEKEPEKYNLSELKGKNLSCWCPKDCKCHADVLLELANR
ncbi:MAG TPA: DUF4326 domain-containing protein [Ferruginibacter sp.]|nr:DUF4326 domain-containing protein [Ferruginibacter sp.]HRQ20505.1 DUF4326 domain-containing protein [Ferruginibacter sp.]